MVYMKILLQVSACPPHPPSFINGNHADFTFPNQKCRKEPIEAKHHCMIHLLPKSGICWKAVEGHCKFQRIFLYSCRSFIYNSSTKASSSSSCQMRIIPLLFTILFKPNIQLYQYCCTISCARRWMLWAHVTASGGFTLHLITGHAEKNQSATQLCVHLWIIHRLH